MILTGQLISATQALEIGLVSQMVASADELISAALKKAKALIIKEGKEEK